MHADVLTISIEQHDHTATIYVGGVLSIASALRLVRVCETLPSVIRTTRLDLSAIHDIEDEALTVLDARLRHWRPRPGQLHVTYPTSNGHRPPPPVRTSGK
jgi:ABC-type transporter Mla MlaB component